MKITPTLRKINDLFWDKGFSPIDINNGHCYHWAYIAYRLLGGQLLYTNSCGGHAWLHLNNKHYDSERLGGVRSYVHLPSFEDRFIEDEDIIEPASVKEFKARWRANGRYGWEQQMCSLMVRQLAA
jgi:hypothetical protein